MNSRMGITRRDFMRDAAGAAALGAAGRVVKLEAAQAPGPAPAGEPLRFASIGTGTRGCEDLKTAISCGADMLAACDLYDGRLIAAQEHAGKSLATTKRYHEILDRKDIDFVIVTTADHWHAKIVQDACAAGKDVYCEKPMTHHVEEGFQIIDAVKKNNRIIQIGSQETSSIVYQKAREIYQSGALGIVSAVECWIDRNGPSGAWDYPIPPGASEKNIDWDTFLGDAPKRPFDLARFFRWRAYSDYGEGLPGDLFVHLLVGLYTIASLQGPPRRALSTGGLFRWKDGRDEPDLIETFYDFPEFRVMMRCNLSNDSAGQVTRIFGDQATLELRDGMVTLTPQDNTPEPETYSTGGWPRKLREEYLKQWYASHPRPEPGEFKMASNAVTYRAPDHYNEDRDHMTNFLNAVRTRQPANEGAELGNWTAIACHMANYSYFNQSPAIFKEGSREITSA
ncbi:MAG: Gfo/Idh/MocA family oxidoreductase [Acidobacteriota bacterium]|nr:Gfo/Idh/MocA family oxidoreductase [Acidobacteriota bacterium]